MKTTCRKCGEEKEVGKQCKICWKRYNKSPIRKEQRKRHNSTPKAIEGRRQYKRKIKSNLTDVYIKGLLHLNGIKNEDTTSKLIKLKREQILITKRLRHITRRFTGQAGSVSETN